MYMHMYEPPYTFQHMPTIMSTHLKKWKDKNIFVFYTFRRGRKRRPSSLSHLTLEYAGLDTSGVIIKESAS